MLSFLAGLWSGFLSFLSILSPFGESSAWRRPWLRWVLHFLAIVLIVILLYVLNSVFEFENNLPTLPPWTRVHFLPVIFLLVYLFLWTAWWIWKLVMAEPPPSTFPDIDAAWAEAVHTLAQAGIRLPDLPLFLVLGRPAAPEEHLFAAAQLPLVVKQSPPGPQAPVHVYATRDAIYVTCAGASLMGKHAANVNLEGIEELGRGAAAEVEAEDPEGQRTIRPTGKEKKVIKQLAHVMGRQMNVVERRTARRALDLPMPDLLKNHAEVETLRARLAHLCRLLVRDRQPFCPINGLLVLLPLGGTDTDQDAQLTAELCARDLETLRRILKQKCPILALLCDLDGLPGFGDFIQRVPPRDRLGRLGQRFPLASPDLAGEALGEQIDRSVYNLCNNYLREWVYRLFRADGAAPTPGNTGLYLFLDEMRSRKRNLSRIVIHGIARETPPPPLYSGCYLAGTGPDKEREQAFVAGVFKRLVENQNFVSWTDDALAEDRRSHGRANLGYTLICGLTIALVAALGYFFFGSRHS